MFAVLAIGAGLDAILALIAEPIIYWHDVKKHGKEYADAIRKRWI